VFEHCVLVVCNSVVVEVCDGDWSAVGWGPTQATIRRGVRWSTYRAYLRRLMHEDNVHILTHATAVKVSLFTFHLIHYFAARSTAISPSVYVCVSVCLTVAYLKYRMSCWLRL